MSDMIEVAKSGRATCRTCKKPIPKDELRFGEEFANQFSVDGEMGHRWHHMKCAAEKFPHKLKDAMAVYEGEIPADLRAELERVADESAKNQKGKSDAFPYVDLAPTGRAKCIQCRETLEKGQPRVAVERELDAGGMTRMGAGYLHPGCTKDYAEKTGMGPIEDVVAAVRKHTTAIGGEELERVLTQVSSPEST